MKDIFKETPNIVSFDFDDTLSMSVYEIPADYSEFSFEYPTRMSSEIKNIIQELYNAGTTIYLVTSRKDNLENRQEVVNFLKENNILGYFKDLIFTGTDKAHTLKQIGSEYHFDDDKHEFKVLKNIYPDSNLNFVHIKHPETPGEVKDSDNWEFEVLNSLQNFLRKQGFLKEYNYIKKLRNKWL